MQRYGHTVAVSMIYKALAAMFLGTGNLCGGIFSVSLSSVSASSPSLVEKYPDCGMAKRQGGPGPANGAPTNHADPLSGMWKDATHGWLENRREAARKDEQASSHKKNTAETKMQIRSGITVIVWFGVSICCFVS